MIKMSHPDVHVRAVLHGEGAAAFMKAFNAFPPVSNTKADDVIILEEGPADDAVAVFVLHKCALPDYSIVPLAWVEKRLGGGA